MKTRNKATQPPRSEGAASAAGAAGAAVNASTGGEQAAQSVRTGRPTDANDRAGGSQSARTAKTAREIGAQTARKVGTPPRAGETAQRKPAARVRHASVFERFKAGVVDMFMLMMPIQYFTTYIIAGSAQAFRTNQTLIAAAGGFYVLLIMMFFIFSGQTPGYRYARLHLRDSSGCRAGLLAVALRTAIWLASFALLFGMLVPFMRKDRAFLHDLASGTRVLAQIETTAESASKTLTGEADLGDKN